MSEEVAPPPARALDAHAAGRYLAEKIGLPVPLSPQRVWSLARKGQLHTIHIGRRVWFQTAALDQFAERGGTRSEVER